MEAILQSNKYNLCIYLDSITPLIDNIIVHDQGLQIMHEYLG